jgi:hypothetical protein
VAGQPGEAAGDARAVGTLRPCGGDLARHALLESLATLDRLDLAVLGRSDADEIFEQMTRDVLDLGDRALEGLGVGLGRLGRSADLAHVLQRGGMHLVVGRRRLEIVENVDASAHAEKGSASV